MLSLQCIYQAQAAQQRFLLKYDIAINQVVTFQDPKAIVETIQHSVQQCAAFLLTKVKREKN